MGTGKKCIIGLVAILGLYSAVKLSNDIRNYFGPKEQIGIWVSYNGNKCVPFVQVTSETRKEPILYNTTSGKTILYNTKNNLQSKLDVEFIVRRDPNASF